MKRRSLLEIYQDSSTSFEESGFENAHGDYWSAPYLYKKVEELGLKPGKIYLKQLDLSRLPWSNGAICSMDDFLYHSVRVKLANHSLPIILCWDGFIMDGWHRIARAILGGEGFVMGYRFESYIEPERKKETK